MLEFEKSIKNELKIRGIHPTIQRIKILEFLMQSKSHPTVDEIYQQLSEEIPSISKATVYNTLHTLTEAALARELRFNDVETRYDATVTPHGHFRCEQCGTIVNFRIDVNNMPFKDLDRFVIREKDVYFKGLCPNCSNQKK